MHRFRTHALAAVAVIFAAIVLSQEVVQTGDGQPPAVAVDRGASRHEAPAGPVAAPRPGAAPWTVGQAAAGERAEPGASPKAIPTPAPGSWGIVSYGTGGGGIFRDADSEAEARLGTQSTGVNGYGSVSGGYFQSSVDSGLARLGWANIGIAAGGDLVAGLFAHTSGEPYAWAAYDRTAGNDAVGIPNPGEYGLYAGGLKAGAYLEHTDSDSCVYLAMSDRGVQGWGDFAGGVFQNTDLTSGAILALTDRGIEARGDAMGGYFEDTESSGAYAEVATGSYKIYGSGTMSFVQNHPREADAVIVYSAPEGDEVATFTRGTGRLVDGEARVSLGKTFRWVTNPDVGLTAHVTPRGEPIPLAVVELSTEEMVVRASTDAPDGIVFDYLVFGLRIGFEESTVVQEKRQEAYIPSMNDHRALAARRPDLAGFTALSKWASQRKAAGLEEPQDLSRAHALRDAIQEYDQAVHGRSEPLPSVGRRPAAAVTTDAEGSPPQQPADAGLARQSGEVPGHASSPLGVDPPRSDRAIHARSFHPSAGELASLFTVSEPVEPGDVLAVDLEHPGMLRLAASSADPTAVGVVAHSPGVLLGASESEGHAYRAAVAVSGVVGCKVDARFGPVYPGDLLVTSPTLGHAMRADAPLPGTVVGKALEEVTSGTATIRVLVMLR